MLEESDSSSSYKMKKLFANKKGNLNLLIPAILVFVIGAAVLTLGVIMISEFRDLPLLSDIGTTVTNETSGFINATTYTLAGTAPGAHAYTVTQARQTTGVVIPAANYTVNAATGLITNATATNYAAAHIDYTYLSGQDAYTSANGTLTGLGSFGSFWSIMVIAVIAAIVIGLVMALASKPGIR